MKKKILIIENLFHFWQISEVVNLLKKDFDCKVLLPSQFIKLVNVKKHYFIKSKFRYLILLHAIFIAKKFDYIYFSTSPEYPDYPTNLKSFLFYFQQNLFFFIFLIFFKKKTIVYIRGVYRFIPEIHSNFVNKFFIWIRKKNFSVITRFVCENNNLRNRFKYYFNKGKKKYLVTTLYTRFYDKKRNIFKKNKKLNIGILGVIDPERKSYNLIYDFSKKYKNKIKLIFLGRRLKKDSTSVINMFKLNDTKYINGFLTDLQLINWGKNCDILVSLNKKELFYGSLKGTASFGDAISLQKPLVAPNFTDVIKEFKDFTYYFKDKKDLEKILFTFLFTNNARKISFNKFSIDILRDKFKKDLILDF
jgi:hypothetical protein